MNYTGMSPLRLWQEVDSLGWRLVKRPNGCICWEPKPPEPMPQALAEEIRARSPQLRALLVMLEQEKPLSRWVR